MLKSFRQGLSAPEKSNGLITPADIENLQLYIDAQEFSNITFASGSGNGDPIASVAGVGGVLGVIDDSGSYPWLYEATGMHSKPAFKKASLPRSIFLDENAGSPAAYDTQVTLVYFFTGIFDGTSDAGELFCLASSSTSNVSVVDSTTMEYDLDETSSPVTISGTYDLSNLTMVAVSYNSLSSLNIKINDGSFQNINPADGYANGFVRLGGRIKFSAGLYHELYGAMLYDRALSEAELNQLYNWGVARYG